MSINNTIIHKFPVENQYIKLILMLAILALMLFNNPSYGANAKHVEVHKNSSINLNSPEKIKTMVIGNPDLIKVTIVKSNLLIINGISFGSTSLTLFGKSGATYDYDIQVSHNLDLLNNHLKKIDARINASSDPNSDAIVLTGMAKNKDLIDSAEEAAIRFFGTYSSEFQVVSPARERTEDFNPRGLSATDTQDSQRVPGPNAVSVSRTSKVESQTRIINLIINEDTLLAAPVRLENLLAQIDNRIRVEEINGVFVLKGYVKTPTALTRALATADRFVAGGNTKPDFSVISDQGGVLAGNTEETQQVMPVTPRVSLGGNNTGGNRGGGNNGGGFGGGNNGGGFGGGNNGGGNNGNGRVNNANATGGFIMSPNKGNIAQNIARGDVVMAANGRVMSQLKVDKNPRVEVQMRIVGVDRDRTEELGIDWRLTGVKTSGDKTTSVSIGSFLGNVVDTLPGINGSTTGTTDIGTSELVLLGSQSTANRILSIASFIRWVETKGAARTLTEPLLTALSGESATFSVGGTLPVLTQDQTTFANNGVTQNTSTAVTFLQYGLGIVVRPTVLENGKISIILDQTLSEPDYSVAVPGFQSARIPGFKTRTVNTITETSSGETWAVAGLLNEEDTNNTRAVPYLSRIPVLGWLFKNESKGKSRKELLLVVTARLIDDDGTLLSSDSKPLDIQNPNEIDQLIKKQKAELKNKQPQAVKSVAATASANKQTSEEDDSKIVVDEKGEFEVGTKKAQTGTGASMLNNQSQYYRNKIKSAAPTAQEN